MNRLYYVVFEDKGSVQNTSNEIIVSRRMSSESFKAQVKIDNFEFMDKKWKIYKSFKMFCPKVVLFTVSTQYESIKISERYKTKLINGFADFLRILVNFSIFIKTVPAVLRLLNISFRKDKATINCSLKIRLQSLYCTGLNRETGVLE